MPESKTFKQLLAESRRAYEKWVACSTEENERIYQQASALSTIAAKRVARSNMPKPRR
jgi:hypothetical protein